MCGIAGIAIKNKINSDLPLLIKRMTASMKHRGPDDEGFVLVNHDVCFPAGSDDTQKESWNSKLKYCPEKSISDFNNEFFLALGHRRLSIIDLSEAAHQPMCNSNGNIWITCNGEIYNYIELREELASKGCRFISQSDIEVLLRAYETWGTACLDKLNGMWSFVIYDKEKNILFGSRDRFGVKPMYYYNDENCFAFASEQKALLKIPFLKKEINYSAVFKHLLHAQVELHEEGFYKNIFELKPAHYFIYDLKCQELSIKKYFSLNYENATTTFSENKLKEYSEKLLEHITHSVDIRLRSDVPVGFCLSGGLDSSTIISVANKLNKENKLSQLTDKITAFTASNESDSSDESKWAKKVVESNNLKWVKVDCRAENILNDLEKLIYHQDIPLYSTSTYAQSKVMQAAKENGITILLDGQGGDELFAGYPVFYTSYYLELLKRFRLNDFYSEWSNISNSPINKGVFVKSLFKIGADKIIPSFANPIFASAAKDELQYFQKSFINSNALQISFANDFNSLPLNASLNKYCTDYYLKNLLRWEDRCSMQYSIESRTPFSDDVDLINFIFSVPSVYKIRKGWSKYLMREAVKGIIPEEIRLRKDKMGFATPQQQWLLKINKDLKKYVFELGANNEIIKTDLLLKNWEQIFNSSKYVKTQDFVWRYVCFLIWKKIFINE